MTKSMIFHYPLPINDKKSSGSQVRPFQMISAFKELGYQVELVTGYVNERKTSIEQIKKDISKGRKFDFLYSEASTSPTLLTEKHHFPTYPFLDFSFFGWLKRLPIKLGLFYRDAYWRFPEYKNLVPWYKRVVTIPFYWYDWLWYQQVIDHLFLPSLAMGNILPNQWPENQVSALPPGCNIRISSQEIMSNLPPKGLQLFYVGGVTPPFYDLRPTIKVVENLQGINFTLCCRAIEWEKVRSYYASINESRIQIVHANSEELEKYYFKADIITLIRTPHLFSDIAMPVKIFEALGYGVPIITFGETEIARFVEREGVGWVVSSQDEFRDILSYLRNHPNEIMKVQQRILAVRHQHTWEMRAQTVVKKLTLSDNRPYSYN